MALIGPEFVILNLINMILFYLLLNQGIVDFGPLLIPLITLSLSIMGFNSLNMFFDLAIDKLSKPDRPLPQQEISPNTVLFASLFFYVISIFIALNYSIYLAGLIIFFIVCSLLYTHPYFYFRKYLFSTNLFGAIFYSVIPFIAAWTINKRLFPLEIFILFTILTGIIATTKEFEDSEIEKKFNIRSWANTFGKTNTFRSIIVAMEGLLIITLILILFGFIEQIYLVPTIVSLSIPLLLKNQKIEDKEVITQGSIVTKAMISLLAIEMIYVLPWLINSGIKIFF